MHTPSQEQWQKVIDTLKSVLHMAPTEENFNMGYGIESYHACGTVACVAGWYVIANTNSKNINKLNPADWWGGKIAIANDLGFEDDRELKTWAYYHPSLWGNSESHGMFCEKFAYNSGIPDAYAKTLADVVNHFEYVKKQCYAYTNKATMADGN